jgi:hypothetical protein
MAIPKDHDPITLYLLEARQKLAETLHDCLITDLSTIETFIQLSEYWYQNGGRSHGEQLKREAEKGILTIRNHLSTDHPAEARLERGDLPPLQRT